MAEVPQSTVLRITDSKTLELLDLYQKEECLWNTTIDDYKNKEMRAKAAEKIAATLNIPHFQARHVLIKFKNLRNSYSQELKKIDRSIALGERVYKPRVFWFSKLDSFIRPHLQPCRGSYEHYLAYQDSEEVVTMSNPEDVLLPDTSVAETSEDESCDSRKRKRHSMKAAKRAKGREEKKAQKEDVFDTFGTYVASLLKNLPPQKALALQPKIVSLITESIIEENNISK